MTRAAGEEGEPGKTEPGEGRGTEMSQKEWVGGGPELQRQAEAWG